MGSATAYYAGPTLGLPKSVWLELLDTSSELYYAGPTLELPNEPFDVSFSKNPHFPPFFFGF